MIVTFLEYCAIRNTISLQRYHSAFYFSVKTHADQVIQKQKNTLRLEFNNCSYLLRVKESEMEIIWSRSPEESWLPNLDHYRKFRANHQLCIAPFYCSCSKAY